MKKRKGVPYEKGLDKDLLDPKFAAHYLTESYSLDDDSFLLALGDVARAYGIADLADQTKLNRESLYKLFSKAGNPRLTSFKRILDTLGFKINIVPAQERRKAGGRR